MTIEIILGSWLSRYILDPSEANSKRHKTISTTMILEMGITVNAVMALCHIPQEEVGLITFNQLKILGEDQLREDGLLKFFPVLIGG